MTGSDPDSSQTPPDAAPEEDALALDPEDAGARAEAAAPADFSEDQRAATRLIGVALAGAGVDLEAGRAKATPRPKARPSSAVAAVLGKAGSGKTHLLAWLVRRLIEVGCKQNTGEADAQRPAASGRTRRRRNPQVSFAVVAPTNKAASVLRARGVAAATIHRILYSPEYDPDYEALAQWLAEPDKNERPEGVGGVAPAQLDRAQELFAETKSAPAALAMIGLRGSDFITGWKRRDEDIAIGLVDEASMLDEAQLNDLREIFQVVILFGDPAQLAPVGQDGEMVFERLPAPARIALSRVHRQAADNPIIDLAYALQQDIAFSEFEAKIRTLAAEDERIEIANRVDSDLMARTPTLVWRNATRIRMIHAFRSVHGLAPDAMSPGEPLICDGLELPARNRHKRVDLEQIGLVKGAQAFWLGEGRKPGFAKIHLSGAPQPQIGVAAIVQIERPDEAEPFIATAARQGALFVHGAACTIHKAQGSQWPTVQVFAPDLFAAARSGRVEAGAPLWRRLAYVAITRAEERLIWATRYAMGKPTAPLEAEDLLKGPLA
ncbi:MAG: ATP-dependent RecD-like DNA helicase [Pseudomonadota bacterium]